jgi:hypothetical protein
MINLHGSVILEKLIVPQLVKKVSRFIEPESSLPCSEESTAPILNQMNPLHTSYASSLMPLLIQSIFHRRTVVPFRADDIVAA